LFEINKSTVLYRIRNTTSNWKYVT